MPDEAGWWFFARTKKDFRSARPILVAMADERGKPGVFSAPPTVKFAVNKTMGFWYGPLKIDIPDPANSKETADGP